MIIWIDTSRGEGLTVSKSFANSSNSGHKSIGRLANRRGKLSRDIAISDGHICAGGVPVSLCNVCACNDGRYSSNRRIECRSYCDTHMKILSN